MLARFPAVLVALAACAVLAGCGGAGGGAGGGATPEPTPAAPPPDATSAQRAALAAQHRASEPEAQAAAPSGADVGPDEVEAAFERSAGFPLSVDEGGDGFESLTVASTDADGNPLPEADRRFARWGAFTLYVGADGRRLADVAALGDVVPSEAPDRDGIVWTKATDAVGETSWTATTFHGGGRIMLAWLGGAEQRTDATFRRLQSLLRRFDG